MTNRPTQRSNSNEEEAIMAKTKKAETEIKAVKAFDHEFKCRGYQYEVGKTYEIEGDVEICRNGFHACDESPFDVWNYYPIIDDEGRLTRYAAVSMHGNTQSEKDEKHSKIASAKITIDAEIRLPDFVKKAVSWLIESTKGKGGEGDNSGYYARIGSSGNSARIGSSGYSAQIGSSGDYARIGSSGDYARIVAEGQNSVIASAGYNARVSGAAGTWVSVAEFDNNGKCVGFATGCIGQDGLEPGVVYLAKGGKLVRAEE